MTINALSGTGLGAVHPGQPDPDQPAAGERGQTARQLAHQLRRQRESSLAWQLLDRQFSRRNADKTGRPDMHPQTTAGGADAVQSDPSTAVATDRLTLSQQASTQVTLSVQSGGASVEYTHFELHVRQVEVTDSGVNVTQLDFTYDRLSLSQAAQPRPPRKSDPLALDLNGDGLQTTGVDNGVRFDLNADGTTDRASVVTGGDAFLALDRNANGRIDDGKELFGDQNGDANGFDALRAYDDNADGVIDAQDAVYSKLRLLDWNADGGQRLRSLQDAGVASISLGYSDTQEALNSVDEITQRASFTRADGSQGEAADLLLGFADAN